MRRSDEIVSSPYPAQQGSTKANFVAFQGVQHGPHPDSILGHQTASGADDTSVNSATGEKRNRRHISVSADPGSSSYDSRIHPAKAKQEEFVSYAKNPVNGGMPGQFTISNSGWLTARVSSPQVGIPGNPTAALLTNSISTYGRRCTSFLLPRDPSERWLTI